MLDFLACLVGLLFVVGLPVLYERLRRSARYKHQPADQDLVSQQKIIQGKASDDAINYYH